MAIHETKRFTFVSQGLPEDTFAVVEFKGTEGISRLYEFDITLASDDPEIDLKGVLQNPATLTIKGSDQDLPIHGILGQFEQLHEVKGRYFYRALLVPRLWQADLYRENQLFLDKTVPHIIEEILKQAGLTTQDYELKLTRSYHQWEYICQYGETDFDFISRWMEREGIYFFFQQGEDNEKLIITDSSTAHEDIRGDSTIPFSPPSGIVPEKEAIMAFICRQKRLPNKVILQDYNYRKPSLDLKAEAEVDSSGRGDVYLYGEHFKTPEEGHELANIRAEEIRCRENVFHGEGTAPNVCPGFFCELDDHYRQGYNQKYLIVEVEHEGHQTGSFWAGVRKERAEGEEKLTYANRFTAIPADLQFRPERKTPKSRFYGTMNATVDAAGAGEYAELDDLGRYKVKLPFDQSDMDGGKASRWVRMSQPYAGAEHGMHFPLHKGTEVLLTFVDGDPDRPVIAGAVPNAETTSPVTGANQTESVIKTAGNNKIRLEDLLGSERIIMETPAANSWIRMGTPNDPDYVRDRLKGKGIKIYTKGQLIEESEDHQAVLLEDPDNEYGSLNFELTDEAYESINENLDKEDLHTQKNIDLIETGEPPAGGLKQQFPKVASKYDEQIQGTLNPMKISNTDRTNIKTTFYGEEDAKVTFSGKDDFINKVEAKYPDPDDEQKGQSKNQIIKSVILRNTINKNAKQRRTEILGDQISITEGSHKMAAINGDVKIDMTDQGIYIDAGEGRDVTIKCRKFHLKNEDEDNITYGDDYAAHFGSNEEYFYGKSEEHFHGKSSEYFYGDKYEEHHGNADEHFYGDKLETHTGTSGEWYLWHKIEGFLGLHESFALSNEFELSAVGKEEIFLGLAFEALLGGSLALNPALQVEWNLAKYENTTFDLAEKKVDFGKKVAEIIQSDARVQFAMITSIG
jgi:type VI secretion system VgrG family protein